MEYAQTLLLNDQGCQTGQVLLGDSCVYTCEGYVSRSDTCLHELGTHMLVQNGRIAVCEPSFVPDETA